tara:strand:+ start:79 stop:813 length:735 start_codon:yes stop_codon:yes gene_type:complete
MLSVNISGFNYHRVLISNLVNLDELSKNSDYLFFVDYLNQNLIDKNLFSKNSALITLGSNVDDFLVSCHDTCRNEIRRTFREEKFVFSNVIKDWNKFHDFYKNCEYARGWMPSPIEELRASKCFQASFDGQLLSGMSCYYNDTHVRVNKIFSLRKSQKTSNIPSVIFSAASRRIVFEICKWAIVKGLKFVDLGGIDLQDSNKKGVSKFKQSFGIQVEPVQIGKVMTPEFRTLVDDLHSKKLDIN